MKWDTAAADAVQNVARRGLRTRCQIIAGSTNNGSFHMGLLFVEIIVMEHSVSVLTPINCDFIYLCNAFMFGGEEKETTQQCQSDLSARMRSCSISACHVPLLLQKYI